jgi:hypothetical protein
MREFRSIVGGNLALSIHSRSRSRSCNTGICGNFICWNPKFRQAGFPLDIFISNRQHVQCAFYSADNNILYEWALKGIEADTATFEELHKSALVIERALKTRRKYKNSDHKDRSAKLVRSLSPGRKPESHKNDFKCYKSFIDEYKGSDSCDDKAKGFSNQRERRNNHSGNW